MDKIKWVVAWHGGIGPNVWNDERVVEADTIREALDVAEQEAMAAGGCVYLIEQQD